MTREQYYKYIKIFLLGIAVLLILWGGYTILKRVTAGGISPFVNFIHASEFHLKVLKEKIGLHEKGSSLRSDLRIKDQQIAELNAALAQYQGLKTENNALRKILQLPPYPGWTGVVAEIIFRDPLYWNQNFKINKGLNDKVPIGAVVLSDGQVIGRIVQNSRHTSEVAMLYSPDCRIGVQIGSSEFTGICFGEERIIGQKEGKIRVDYLPRDLQVPAGTLLTTSGLGDFMPKGLPVANAVYGANGAVVQIQEQSRGYLNAAVLMPLNTIHFVVVLFSER
ncbi:MAG: rod shape-determining protein MreC [Lentisphaeria bacterium]